MENDLMFAILTLATVIVPIATALTELVKRTVKVKNNYIPVITFALGLMVGVFMQPFTDLDLISRLWAGGLAGLAGTGLYEIAFSKREGESK
jgi:hypothetical protein